MTGRCDYMLREDPKEPTTPYPYNDENRDESQLWEIQMNISKNILIRQIYIPKCSTKLNCATMKAFQWSDTGTCLDGAGPE